ncbi:MAG TPA: class I SAM-dependent methyltransferase [Ktedonobacteraceae bacterium]|nr:class I SAM-dependent methyltransferase [Ktedonobacteraceae bacterium]
MQERSVFFFGQHEDGMAPVSTKDSEIDCGNGYLSLELARGRHEVIGLDTSPEIINLAERSKQAHPAPSSFGKITYVCEDFHIWSAGECHFDVVIFNRTLHHMHGLQTALTKVKRLLTNNGLLVCQDYAYDRLNDQTASWMYTMQRLLFLSHLSEEDLKGRENEAQSIEAFREAWFQKADQRLNRWEEITQALQAAFSQHVLSWVLYLFIPIGNSIHHSESEQERALLTFLRDTEQFLVEKGYIQAVGFRSVGSPQ